MLLKGLKVVDFTAYIAGPGAAAILCDWGAEVTKVERPGGDNMRHVFADLKNDIGANPTFDVDNRGKRGIVLDITKPAGRDALAKLAETADVFLTNTRPVSLTACTTVSSSPPPARRLGRSSRPAAAATSSARSAICPSTF